MIREYHNGIVLADGGNYCLVAIFVIAYTQ